MPVLATRRKGRLGSLSASPPNTGDRLSLTRVVSAAYLVRSQRIPTTERFVPSLVHAWYAVETKRKRRGIWFAPPMQRSSHVSTQTFPMPCSRAPATTQSRSIFCSYPHVFWTSLVASSASTLASFASECRCRTDSFFTPRFFPVSRRKVFSHWRRRTEALAMPVVTELAGGALRKTDKCTIAPWNTRAAPETPGPLRRMSSPSPTPRLAAPVAV